VATNVQTALVELDSDLTSAIATLNASIALKASLSGATFTGAVVVPYEIYGSGWNGSNQAPTKDAIYDKIESLGGGSSDATAEHRLLGGI
jgi:alpha-tubulin suppressor-like RCC1 family protein